MKTISWRQLPKKALAAISKRQRSYIDEFVFKKYEDGSIEAHYGGEYLATWGGKSWIELR